MQKKINKKEKFIEDFFGELSIKNKKYKFTLEDYYANHGKTIPFKFCDSIKNKEIEKIIKYKLKITAKSTYEDGILKSLEILKISKKENENK